MLFNSIEFFIFFPLVTFLYFALPHRFRWGLLLAASCGFYMAFVPAYIFILLATILVDYFAAIWIERSRSALGRKNLLIVSIISTCSILFFFKYFNFFNQGIDDLARLIGWNYPIRLLEIILPIGLSFHTFQSLSYVIEVYRGNQKAERHFGIYSLYVMFYPQLVAGPIERPQNLLHQFHARHRFDAAKMRSGLQLMLWGLLKKVVIADRLALTVNLVYGDPASRGAGDLVVATVFFAFQIYCDFSGYSDIARGAARVMGFELMKNFDRPYASRSIGEFWTRWHISLSTWFRDYVYIPLGGNRKGKAVLYRNLFITFLISGLWHGANWTYIIWGALNGTYLIVEGLLKGEASGPRFSHAKSLFKVAVTFTLICASWVFFRAASLPEALSIFKSIALGLGSPLPTLSYSKILAGFGLIALLEVAQWAFRSETQQARWDALPRKIRWAVYYAGIAIFVLIGEFGAGSFIYFQF